MINSLCQKKSLLQGDNDMIRNPIYCLLISSLFLWSTFAESSCKPSAGKCSFTNKFNVNGTIIATAKCNLSPESIDIDFGDVYISDLVGDTFQKTINYKLNCTGEYGLSDIELSFTGGSVTTYGGEKLLRTNIDGIDIKLFNGDNLLEPGETIKITNVSSPPELKAAVIKESGVDFLTINGAYFYTSATLKVDFP